MDQLYPIIRRKRRPLVQENPETLKIITDGTPVAATPLVEPATISKPDDVENASSNTAP